MTDWGNGVLCGRRSVWIRGWSQCGVAHRCSVKRKQSLFPDLAVVHRRQLHKEVMGMLTIHDGKSERSFALLEQLGVASLGDCCRFEAQHRSYGKGPIPELPLSHRHEPICREQFVPATRAGLLNVVEKCCAVEHERPATLRRHEHLEGR